MLSLVKGAREPTPSDARGPRDDLAELAKAAANGDPRSVRTFVVAVGSVVLGAVRMILGASHGDVEDVTQDAIVALLAALPRFRGECTVSHLAARVGILTAMAARRRQRSRERWIATDESLGERVATGPESSPLALLESGRRREKVRRLLDELSEPIAEAIALHFMLGHTVDEIASSVGVPVNTVWSRLRVGKERLRQRLANDSGLSDELAKAMERKR